MLLLFSSKQSDRQTIGKNNLEFGTLGVSGTTLAYRIEVQARLLILKENSQLHGLILVCTFINFEEISPPALYDLNVLSVG